MTYENKPKYKVGDVLKLNNDTKSLVVVLNTAFAKDMTDRWYHFYKLQSITEDLSLDYLLEDVFSNEYGYLQEKYIDGSFILVDNLSDEEKEKYLALGLLKAERNRPV